MSCRSLCDDVQGPTLAYLCPRTNGPIILVANDFGAQKAHYVLEGYVSLNGFAIFAYITH